MAHVKALQRQEMGPLEPVIAAAENAMGFVPNSMLTMARMPQLVVAFSMLAGVTMGADLRTLLDNYRDLDLEDPASDEALPRDLIQLIAYGVSLSAGCRYCQAHTSHGAHAFGVDERKLADYLNYATSDLFTPAEKAVAALALAAGQVPNQAEDAHFTALGEHFSARQITQIVAVIALFGFLNRWNDTMGTDLEASPAEFAGRVLAPGGWAPGKHAG